eukprot:gene13398-biopygen14091
MPGWYAWIFIHGGTTQAVAPQEPQPGWRHNRRRRRRNVQQMPGMSRTHQICACAQLRHGLDTTLLLLNLNTTPYICTLWCYVHVHRPPELNRASEIDAPGACIVWGGVPPLYGTTTVDNTHIYWFPAHLAWPHSIDAGARPRPKGAQRYQPIHQKVSTGIRRYPKRCPPGSGDIPKGAHRDQPIHQK